MTQNPKAKNGSGAGQQTSNYANADVWSVHDLKTKTPGSTGSNGSLMLDARATCCISASFT